MYMGVLILIIRGQAIVIPGPCLKKERIARVTGAVDIEKILCTMGIIQGQ